MKKMNKFVAETLLPSLFERWEGRDKRYPSIIISEREWGVLLGQCGTEFRWEGRICILHRRGRWCFLSFGQTEAEQQAIAALAEAREMEREVSSAQRMAAKAGGKSREVIAKMLNSYEERLRSLVGIIEDEESDPEYIAWAMRQEAHVRQVIEILIGGETHHKNRNSKTVQEQLPLSVRAADG